MRLPVVAGVLVSLLVACGGQEPPPKPVEARPADTKPADSAAPTASAAPADSSEGLAGKKLGGGGGFGGGGFGGGPSDAPFKEVKIPAPTTKPHPKGSARLGKLTVDGAPSAAVEKAIGEAKKNVLICYENALADNPKLEGKIAPELIVPDEGNTVVKKEGESDLPKDVQECVVEALRLAPYPKPAKGKLISIAAPMVLSVAK